MWRPRCTWGPKHCERVGSPCPAHHRRHRLALLCIQPLPPPLLEASRHPGHLIHAWLQPPQALQHSRLPARRAGAAAVELLRAWRRCVAGRQPARALHHLLPAHLAHRLLHAPHGYAVKAEAHMHKAIKQGSVAQCRGA